jgi:hypothetical protein
MQRLAASAARPAGIRRQDHKIGCLERVSFSTSLASETVVDQPRRCATDQMHADADES